MSQKSGKYARKMGRRLDRLEKTVTDVLGETAGIPEGFTGRTLTLRIKYILEYVILGTKER